MKEEVKSKKFGSQDGFKELLEKVQQLPTIEGTWEKVMSNNILQSPSPIKKCTNTESKANRRSKAKKYFDSPKAK